MTWLRKFRGDSTAPILAEYECPVHGRFEVTVPRPAPDTMECPELVELDPIEAVECSMDSPWRFPMPRTSVKAGEAVKGKVMEYPPEHVVMDTRPLADGVPYGEWRAKQDAITRDLGLKRARAGRR